MARSALRHIRYGVIAWYPSGTGFTGLVTAGLLVSRRGFRSFVQAEESLHGRTDRIVQSPAPWRQLHACRRSILRAGAFTRPIVRGSADRARHPPCFPNTPEHPESAAAADLG